MNIDEKFFTRQISINYDLNNIESDDDDKSEGFFILKHKTFFNCCLKWFNDIYKWNLDFGNDNYGKGHNEINVEFLKSRINLIAEEVKEFEASIDMKTKKIDFIEYIDALCDIIFTVIGLFTYMYHPVFYTKSCDIEVFIEKVKSVHITYQDKRLRNCSNDFKFIGLLTYNINKFYNMSSKIKFEKSHKMNVSFINKYKSLSWDILALIYYQSIQNPVYIDLQKHMEIVIKANNSKVCKTFNIAQKTKFKYESEKRYKNIDIKKNGDVFIVYTKNGNKILKSIEWEEPDHKSIQKVEEIPFTLS